MSILKRLGTHQVKLEFHIKVHYISLRLSKPVPVKVSWKRRNKLSETSKIELSEPRTDFSQTLSMSNTIYQKSSGFLPKEAEIKVLGDFFGNWKELGRVVINLSEFIDIPANQQVFSLQKTQEKDGMICLSISTELPGSTDTKGVEHNTDELIRQLNDAKNKLSALKNDFDEVLSQKEQQKLELIELQKELKILTGGNASSETLALQQENIVFKKQLEDCRQELMTVRQTNESLRSSIKKQESILVEHGFKSEYSTTVEELKEEPEEIEDQVSKLGARLNDIMRRYTVMPK